MVVAEQSQLLAKTGFEALAPLRRTSAPLDAAQGWHPVAALPIGAAKAMFTQGAKCTKRPTR